MICFLFKSFVNKKNKLKKIVKKKLYYPIVIIDGCFINFFVAKKVTIYFN